MVWNPLWEDVYRSRPWGQYPPEDVIRFVAGHFYAAPDRSKVRLLEVGSGAGANLWFMAREGFCVHGVEGSATAVRLIQDRLDRESPDWRRAGAQVVVGDMTELPYPESYFDGALDVAAGCYCSFEQARRAYGELARVVKPGGKLFVRTFAHGCWGEGTGTQVDKDTWACADGPLAGLGATRFTDPADLNELMPGWKLDRIEHSSLSEQGGRHRILHLLIHGTRT